MKGRSAPKLRLGDVQMHFTRDLDAAYAGDLDAVLRRGCEGFTGRIAERESLYILPAFWYGKRPVRVGQTIGIKIIL